MEKYLNPDRPEPPFAIRWTILVLLSLAMFGNYYIYDSISPVADLLSKQLNFSDSDIGLLNGIYSLPNIIMVLIGGIIIDRIGTRSSLFIFAFLCMAGAAVTAYSDSLIFMAAGRLIFGLGAESLIVGITTAIGRWFKGKQLSLAFGLNITIARFGTIVALNSPTWAKGLYDSWQLPLLLAVGAGVISVLSIIFYWQLDVHAARKYKVKQSAKQDKVYFRELFSFSKSFWLLVLLCVTFYSAVFPFKTFGIKLFIDEYGLSRADAGGILSTLDFSAMIFTPLFGLLVDFIGHRSKLMMLASMALLPVFLIMVYTNIPLLIPMMLMGFAYSMIPAIIWPSVAFIVKEDKLGTAYGVMTMIQAVGLTVMNFMIGAVNDASGGYQAGMWLLSGLGILGIIFSFLLFLRESGKDGHGLEKGLTSK